MQPTFINNFDDNYTELAVGDVRSFLPNSPLWITS